MTANFILFSLMTFGTVFFIDRAWQGVIALRDIKRRLHQDNSFHSATATLR